MKISIVIPTLNEEENLPVVMKDVKDFLRKKGYDYEILVVDGYSSDRTIEIAKKHGARILYDKYGKGSALVKGIGASKGDIIITMDADCSHKANEIGMLIEGISAGFDICMGSRFIQGGGTDDMPFLRKMGNRFFVYLVNSIWNMNYSDLCYGYRSFGKGAVKKMKLKSKGFGCLKCQATKSSAQTALEDCAHLRTGILF